MLNIAEIYNPSAPAPHPLVTDAAWTLAQGDMQALLGHTLVRDALQRLEMIRAEDGRWFYERDFMLLLMDLAIISGNDVFFVGPPGTGKTLASDFHVERHVLFPPECGVRPFFKYMMNEWTNPSELIGPEDIPGLRERGIQQRITTGRAGEAVILRLDEITRTGPAALNLMLPLLNEREFFNGGEMHRSPVRSAIALANNEFDMKAPVAAARNRLTLGHTVGYLGSQNRQRLLRDQDLRDKGTWQGPGVGETPLTTIHLQQLELLGDVARLVEIPDATLRAYNTVIDKCIQEDIRVSDRQAIQGMQILRLYALLQGEAVVQPHHLTGILHAVLPLRLALDPADPQSHPNVIAGIMRGMRELQVQANRSGVIEDAARDAYQSYKNLDGRTDLPDEDKRALRISLKTIVDTRLAELQTLQADLQRQGKPTRDVERALDRVRGWNTEIAHMGLATATQGNARLMERFVRPA